MIKIIIAGLAIGLIFLAGCVAIGLIGGCTMRDIATVCAVLVLVSCLGVGLTSIIIAIIEWAID